MKFLQRTRKWIANSAILLICRQVESKQWHSTAPWCLISLCLLPITAIHHFLSPFQNRLKLLCCHCSVSLFYNIVGAFEVTGNWVTGLTSAFVFVGFFVICLRFLHVCFFLFFSCSVRLG